MDNNNVIDMFQFFCRFFIRVFIDYISDDAMVSILL